MKRLIFFTLATFLILFLNSQNINAGTTEQGTLSLDDLIANRIEKIKDTLSTVISKLMLIQSNIDSNSSAFFVLTHVNKDAGPLLNSRLDWLKVESAANKNALGKYVETRGTVNTTSLVLPSQWETKVKDLAFDANLKAADFDFKNLDFNWITDLQKFDYWSVEDNSPIAHLEKIDLSALPVPDFNPLITWAKLRLIKGIQENNAVLAIDETIHLGRLAHSTETLAGALASIAIADEVLKFAKAQGKGVRFEAKALSQSKVYFPALGKVLGLPFVNSGHYAKLLQVNSSPGFCAAANTAAESLLMYRTALEEDLKPVYGGFTNLMNTSTRCRWKVIRKAWAGDPRVPRQFTDLTKLGLKARKKQSEALKDSVTPEEYKQLQSELVNPKWPQLYVYLVGLKSYSENQFDDLLKK